jgi:hypothetical protein
VLQELPDKSADAVVVVDDEDSRPRVQCGSLLLGESITGRSLLM